VHCDDSSGLFYWPDLYRGARACLAPTAAVFIFAFALGALTYKLEWSMAYLILFILGVTGASVQAVAIQMWTPTQDIFPLFAACFSVQVRYILICASIEPLLSRLSFFEKVLAVHFTTDSNWAVTIAEKLSNKKVSAAFLLGGGMMVIGGYLTGNVAGFLSAEQIPDIRTLGLDFAIPGVFLCLLLSFCKSLRTDLLAWGVAVVVSLVSKFYINGGWYILLGAVSGACTSGLLQLLSPMKVKHAS
jgi:predicted branched-subunit amino acid permease